MTTESLANGSSSTAEPLSAAQQLMEKHEASSHKPTVEEVVDEEDILHPPPSTSQSSRPDSAASTPTWTDKGKERADDEAVPVPVKKAEKLDTQSEELFPALGTPKPRAPVSVPSWGRKPASLATNGVNGSANGLASSNASSRSSTPASGATPQVMSLPGRYIERVQFAPSQLTPRNQLKKPVNDILRDINKRSKAKVELKPGQGGMVIFEGQGSTQDAVRQALKEVAKELGSKQSVKVAIPASVRAHVIGRQGATIQAISKKTGAKIQVPKGEAEGPAEGDDSATIDVLIEGDAVAAEMARREIEAIVNERTSTVNLKLRDIPAEFYPFIAGAHNARVNQLEEGRDLRIQVPRYHNWVGQAPPQVARGQPAPFTAQAANPIHISGDRQAAQEARAEIERQVEALKRQLTVDQMPIERGRHQFIVGERGSSLHDFLEETGCTVILPPDSDQSETLYIVGPPDKIENGINKVMDLASSMSMASVDVARQHANAPMGAQTHARNLARYLRQRRAVEELERLHNASVVLPTSADGPTAWDIYSRDGKNTMRARTDIVNLINGHPPSRLRPMDVDPFYFHHLQQRHAQAIRDQHGVHLVFPEEVEETPELLLVYEGPAAPSEYSLPRGAPSPAEIQAFQKQLQQAQQQILSLIGGREPIVKRDVEAAPKFHEKLRRYVDREQQSLPNEQIPVQLLFGERRSPSARGRLPHGAQMRGPSNAVDELAAKIQAFLEQEQKDELERGYTTSFDYPQKYANILIGKRGENIKKLRDEFDVDIQVNDGKVELKGPQVKCERAKAHIIALAKKLEDEATHVLKIKPQYHRDLIGAKGSQVNRLQDRYNVRINFPRTTQVEDADEAAEGGQSQKNYRFQAPDEVVIRGPKRGADEAREELLNLLQYVIDNSFTATVSVAQNQIPSLIGSGGREMENLRLSTGAQIDVPSVREAADPSGRVEIKLKGTKKQVEDAKKMLEERAKVFDDTVSQTIEVDKKHHKALIGSGGSNIRDIVVKAGGPDDRRELARMVRFPRPDADESTIRVEGRKDIVEKIVAALQSQVSSIENRVTETLEIAPEKHRLLIGRGGETRRNLESEFDISLDIPKQSVTGDARNAIRITGVPEDVEKAKAHILSLVKDQEGETVEVPRRLHNVIADNGSFFRRLRNDLKVTVDHAGQQPPARPAGGKENKPQGRKVNGDMPLITDDPAESVDSFSWEIVDHSADAPGEEGTIPWVLRGSAENIAKAKKMLQSVLESASKPSVTGYLILPDPKTYRLVIGPGGSQINSIRKKTGTKVQVPRDQAKGEAIEIQGTKEGVEEAKEIILNVVRNGGSGRRS